MNRKLSVAAACGAILVLFLAAYVLPRRHHLDVLQGNIEAAEKARVELDRLIPLMAEQDGPLAPAPKPNVTSWISANALRGLDRRVTTNSPYKNGQAGELKLRSLKPEEVTQLLNILTQVNMIVRRFRLSDLGARGVWDLELMLELPEGTP